MSAALPSPHKGPLSFYYAQALLAPSEAILAAFTEALTFEARRYLPGSSLHPLQDHCTALNHYKTVTKALHGQ